MSSISTSAKGDGHHGAESQRLTRLIPLAAAVLAGCGLLWLLGRLLFEGWAHSFDSLLYARSLWGLAHGEAENPIVGVHALAVHGHFTSLVLVPLARVMPAAMALVLAQSASLAATVWLVVRAFLGVDAGQARAGRPRAARSLVTGLVVLLLVTLGSPLVLNPFLFDARPDVIAIPLMLAGLLRVEQRGSFDLRSLVWFALAALSREEFAFVVATAAVVAPLSTPLSKSYRQRLIIVVAALAYWLLYWFVVRKLLGGDFAVARSYGASALFNSAEGNLGLGTSQLLLYKVEIVVAAALSMGALAALGRRWLLVALPGVAFLLISTRMQALVLNGHYAIFAAPGLLVAAVAGYRRLAASRAIRPRLAWVAAGGAVGLFLLSGAAPGGGRFRAENFCFEAPALRRVFPAAACDASALRGLVERIPPTAGAMLPYALAAPAADRSTVLPTEALETLFKQQGLPWLEKVDWILLPGRHWRGVGRFLVAAHGFRVVDRYRTQLALLSRDPAARPRGRALGLLRREDVCKPPVSSWPAVGLELCGHQRLPTGRLAVTLARSGPASSKTPLVLTVRPQDAAGRRGIALWALRGLLQPAQLRAGQAAVFISERAVPTSKLALWLVGPRGRPVVSRPALLESSTEVSTD